MNWYGFAAFIIAVVAVNVLIPGSSVREGPSDHASRGTEIKRPCRNKLS